MAELPKSLASSCWSPALGAGWLFNEEFHKTYGLAVIQRRSYEVEMICDLCLARANHSTLEACGVVIKVYRPLVRGQGLVSERRHICDDCLHWSNTDLSCLYLPYSESLLHESWDSRYEYRDNPMLIGILEWMEGYPDAASDFAIRLGDPWMDYFLTSNELESRLGWWSHEVFLCGDYKENERLPF